MVRLAPFIVGIPRSGTTLFRLLLDAHPDLAIPPETGFGDVLAELASRSAPAEELIDLLVSRPAWRELSTPRCELETLAARVCPWTPAGLLREWYLAYAARHGATRYGDKTPTHLERLEVLAAAFPEARFLHLIRDGRDVAVSLRGLPFAPGDGSIEAIALAWSSGILEARRVAQQLPQYLEIRYEQLVTAPEDTLRQVCGYLDLSFDPAMLRAHERAAERLAEAVQSRGGSAFEAGLRERVRGRLLQPPDPAAVGGWRAALSAEEVHRFEAVAGSTLELLGYGRAMSIAYRAAPPSHRPVPIAQRSALLSDQSALLSDQSPAGLRTAAPYLRVVIATHSLAGTGGTQSYVLTIANQLQRLGHQVTVTADEWGDQGAVTDRDGIPVARSPAELPADCDALLVNDAIVTGRLVERYPQARVVHVAHSSLYDVQLPIALSGVVDAVVVMSERVAARVHATAVAAPIVRLRQPIDTERFVAGPPIRRRPRRALLLGNYLHGERLRALVEVWQAAGVECHQVGLHTREELDVVPQIAEADIVVGKARAALEGMSCARAVYVFDHFGGDGWVTPENYAQLEADNFAGLATAMPRTPHEIAADLERYDPDMGWLNLELIRTHHTARQHAAVLVEVLRDPHPARSAAPAAPTAIGEMSRLTGLLWRAEIRQRQLDRHTHELVERTREAEARTARAEAALARLAAIEPWVDSRRMQLAMALGNVLDLLRRWR